MQIHVMMSANAIIEEFKHSAPGLFKFLKTISGQPLWFPCSMLNCLIGPILLA